MRFVQNPPMCSSQAEAELYAALHAGDLRKSQTRVLQNCTQRNVDRKNPAARGVGRGQRGNRSWLCRREWFWWLSRREWFWWFCRSELFRRLRRREWLRWLCRREWVRWLCCILIFQIRQRPSDTESINLSNTESVDKKISFSNMFMFLIDTTSPLLRVRFGA
jgi:hypothetical protein